MLQSDARPCRNVGARKSCMLETTVWTYWVNLERNPAVWHNMYTCYLGEKDMYLEEEGEELAEPVSPHS